MYHVINQRDFTNIAGVLNTSMVHIILRVICIFKGQKCNRSFFRIDFFRKMRQDCSQWCLSYTTEELIV